jgi:precorrin-3B C17-methyltransferase
MDKKQGMLFLVGIGPGRLDEMTLRARAVLERCDLVAGYTTYIRLIEPLIAGKQVIASGMTREQERCRRAIDEARQGKTVALISSGDSGLYGMAGLVLELMESDGEADEIPVEIVPGVPAFIAAAAALGAPLMNDCAIVSLSDLLTPWETIEKRLTAAASGDFVTCLYNPKSATRTAQIEQAIKIFSAHREADTPAAIVRSVTRPEEYIVKTTLGHILDYDMDMLCLVIIGNSSTLMQGTWMITSRGYAI